VVTPQFATAAVIMVLVLLPVALYVGARLIAMTPAAAVESGGPFALIGRSWALTAGHVWKLIAFLVLVVILIGILVSAIEAVAGILFALAAGPLRPGSLSQFLVILVMAIVNMVVTAYLTTLLARIYAQLAGGAETQRVFA
jgi:glycerophosphoryl diester phosphodiesterase family protein